MGLPVRAKNEWEWVDEVRLGTQGRVVAAAGEIIKAVQSSRGGAVRVVGGWERGRTAWD